MLSMKTGRVVEILKEGDDITEVIVEINNMKYKAMNYNELTGKIKMGDNLLLNTTAVDLNLGTGGYHFVIANTQKYDKDLCQGGHIMKLRYTPYQVKVFSAEEQDSKFHHIFNEFKSLNDMPVIVGTLHSMLSPIIEVLKNDKKDIKIAYIMTDGAALPISFSHMVKKLKEKQLLCGTITIGNAFGGDLDCVNIYNGLIAAKEILKCDIAIVTMGPGIVGTGTKYGFSGIEQGAIIDAVNDLGGIPIAIPRISFADSRSRHKGISHHSITVLDKIAKTKAVIGIPHFEEKKHQYICAQIYNTKIEEKHNMIYIDPSTTINILENATLKMSTMGRSFQEDMEYFITAGVSAQLAIKILDDPQLNLLK
ncbi:DUF3866 family protein [Clostridiaceae bacterium 35-E11]